MVVFFQKGIHLRKGKWSTFCFFDFEAMWIPSRKPTHIPRQKGKRFIGISWTQTCGLGWDMLVVRREYFSAFGYWGVGPISFRLFGKIYPGMCTNATRWTPSGLKFLRNNYVPLYMSKDKWVSFFCFASPCERSFMGSYLEEHPI